jgi:hypothetical protein
MIIDLPAEIKDNMRARQALWEDLRSKRYNAGKKLANTIIGYLDSNNLWTQEATVNQLMALMLDGAYARLLILSQIFDLKKKYTEAEWEKLQAAAVNLPGELVAVIERQYAAFLAARRECDEEISKMESFALPYAKERGFWDNADELDEYISFLPDSRVRQKFYDRLDELQNPQ